MIKVTAAILLNKNNIFIAQRPEGKFMGGKWELPGGKIELNETEEECIKRELREELGIEVSHTQHFLTTEYDYDKISVKISSFIVKSFKGSIDLKEHTDAKWVNIDEVFQYDILEADIPILKRIVKKIGG